MKGPAYFHRVPAVSTGSLLQKIRSLGTLVEHWDASTDDNVTIDTGVSQLNGLVNGWHLSNSTGAEQPTHESGGPNGNKFLRFDGSDDILRTSPEGDMALTGQPFTLVMAVKPTITGSGNVLCSIRYYDGADMFEHIVDNEATGTKLRCYCGSGWSNFEITPTMNKEWMVIAVTINGASSRLRVHGTGEVSGNSGPGWGPLGSADTDDEFVIGAYFTSTVTGWADMEFGEAFLWDSALTDDEIDDYVIPYLSSRWVLENKILTLGTQPTLWQTPGGMVHGGGANCYTWNGRKPTNVHFDQATAGNRPLYIASEATLNNSNAIHMDSDVKWMDEDGSGGVGSLTDFTVYVVGSLPDPSTNKTHFALSNTGGGSHQFYLRNSAGTDHMGFYDSTAHRTIDTALNGAQYWTWVADATALTAELRISGTSLGTVTYDGSIDASATVRIGQNGGANDSGSKYTEIIIFNVKHTAEEVAIVESYLAAKYGL